VNKGLTEKAMKSLLKKYIIISLCFIICTITVPCFSREIVKSSNDAKRAWGPEQAVGAPDTFKAGDMQTAWATLSPDAGIEWLHVEFQKKVTISEIRIRETYNPGAVIKVSVFIENGNEVVVWEGNDTTEQVPSDFTIKVDKKVISKSVKIYLDTAKVSGWNEIDAVQLIATDGMKQYAQKATASSTYASVSSHGYVPYDPFTQMINRDVEILLDEEVSVTGKVIKNYRYFISIKRKNSDQIILINKSKIIYIELVK
jgi:hypothetical protein